MSAAPKGIRWSIGEVTRAKHQLLRSYLEWWFPTALQQQEHVYYIDGFAGPGAYLEGDLGSPLIAVEALLNHTTDPQQIRRVSFIFIEKRKDRSDYLNRLIQKKIEAQPLLKNLDFYVDDCDFSRTMNRRLTKIEKNLPMSSPIFAFIDPFGYKDIPMTVIARLLQLPQCEVLLTLIYEESYRFLTHPQQKIQNHLTALFGGKQWKQLIGLLDCEQQFCNLYCTQLQAQGNITHTRALRLKTKKAVTKYFLVFGTRHPDHLKQMEEVHWNVAPHDGYTFVESANLQPVLFPLDPTQNIKSFPAYDHKHTSDAQHLLSEHPSSSL